MCTLTPFKTGPYYRSLCVRLRVPYSCEGTRLVLATVAEDSDSYSHHNWNEANDIKAVDFSDSDSDSDPKSDFMPER